MRAEIARLLDAAHGREVTVVAKLERGGRFVEGSRIKQLAFRLKSGLRWYVYVMQNGIQGSLYWHFLCVGGSRSLGY